MASMLDLVLHGGKCCGVKHIRTFVSGPSYTEPYVPARLGSCGLEHGADCKVSFYPHEMPAETTLQRLDRFLDYLKKHRKGGIVEIVLISSQKKLWHDILIDRGFDLVTKCYNSNSGNHLFMYILSMGGNKLQPEDMMTVSKKEQ